MDPQRLKATYRRLESLDDRLTHKLRPRGGGTFARPGMEQMEERLRDLAAYTVELKEIVHDLMVAIASAPAKPDGGGAEKA